MVTQQVEPADMARAASATSDQARAVASGSATDALSEAGAAIPGADAARHLEDLAGSWSDDQEDYSAAVEGFAEQIMLTSVGTATTDAEVGGAIGGGRRGGDGD